MKILHIITSLLLTLAFTGCNTSDNIIDSEYNSAYCETVAGSSDIHWEALEGWGPCTGIEFTNKYDTKDGKIQLVGYDVNDSGCIGFSTYEFILSNDGLSLVGSDINADVNMTLTRQADEECFVGHWVTADYDYRAHISVDEIVLSPLN